MCTACESSLVTLQEPSSNVIVATMTEKYERFRLLVFGSCPSQLLPSFNWVSLNHRETVQTANALFHSLTLCKVPKQQKMMYIVRIMYTYPTTHAYASYTHSHCSIHLRLGSTQRETTPIQPTLKHSVTAKCIIPAVLSEP